MSEQEIDKWAKTIWDYMLMHHELYPVDVIFLLGTSDTRVAERGAELYHAGYAPLIVASGFRGVRSPLPKPEAEVFADILIRNGVPKERILIEPRASNTGENILFTKELLTKRGMHIQSIIAAQKPYMERRTWATIRKQWPEVECLVTSPQVSFEEYETDPQRKRKFLETMIGDLQRIRDYPKYGFQIDQEIPENVWEAQEKLVEMGYGSRPPKPPLK